MLFSAEGRERVTRRMELLLWKVSLLYWGEEGGVLNWDMVRGGRVGRVLDCWYEEELRGSNLGGIDEYFGMVR